MAKTVSIHNQFIDSTFNNTYFIFNKVNVEEDILSQCFKNDKYSEGLSDVSNIELNRKANLTKRSNEVVESLAEEFERNKDFDSSSVKHCMLKTWSGEGKTTIAIEFAYKFGKQFISSFGIDASSSIGDQYVKIAENLLGIILPTDLEKEKVRQFQIDSVKNYINTYATLLILDNIDKIEDCEVFFPKKGKSRCILITTNFNIRSHSILHEVELPKLSEMDSLQILLQDIDVAPKELNNAKKIASVFDYSPFALELANNYLKDYSDIELELFIKEISESSIKWSGLTKSKGINFIHSSPSVISLIEKRLDKLCEDGIDFISRKILSVIGCLCISEFEFEYKILQNFIELPQDNLERKLKFNKIKNRLESLGLAKTSKEKFIIHTLTLEYLKLIYLKNEDLANVFEYVTKESDSSLNMQLQLGRLLPNTDLKRMELLMMELEKSDIMEDNPVKFSQYYLIMFQEYKFYDPWLKIFTTLHNYEYIRERSIEYTNKAYNLIDKSSFERRDFALKQILFDKAYAHHMNSKIEIALELYNEFIYDMKTRVPIPMILEALINTMKINCIIGDFEKAQKISDDSFNNIEHFYKNGNIKKAEYEIYRFKTTYYTGMIYTQQKDNEKSKKIYDDAIQIAEQIRDMASDSYSKNRTDDYDIGHPKRYPLEIAIDIKGKGSLMPIGTSYVLEPLWVRKED
jgi:hypothetical protein